ncbi:MAG: glycerophosphodiester phosphodiesterase family protein [Sandaracinaceae bacterium]|nr:glycerophosphodiester phosphodiesterase family protein [Sandaracinaceae bacterium]
MSYLRSPIAFAHRGGAALWPENTRVAFEGALALGYRYVETDVHMTRDGKIVCFHDATLERTTNGRGRVADLDLAELSRLDAGYRFTPDGVTYPFRGRGLRVPTLEEALALSPDLRLNVEIKQASPAMERALWEEIDRLDAHERLLVAAAHDPLVHRFRALRPRHDVPTSPGVRGVLRFWLGVRTGLRALRSVSLLRATGPAELPRVDRRRSRLRGRRARARRPRARLDDRRAERDARAARSRSGRRHDRSTRSAQGRDDRARRLALSAQAARSGLGGRRHGRSTRSARGRDDRARRLTPSAKAARSGLARHAAATLFAASLWCHPS